MTTLDYASRPFGDLTLPISVPGEDPASPPLRALVLSVVALIVAASLSLIWPQSVRDYSGFVWILALVPVFLLSYYKGWRGAAIASACAMVLFAFVEIVAVRLLGRTIDWWLFGIATTVLIVTTLGVGTVSEMLHRRLTRAVHLSFQDPLTGLPSRRALDFFLSKQVAAAERGEALSIVFFDLDDFKTYNDLHGHSAGDEALRKVGEVLRRNTREMNLTGRYGGEEFLSVLPGEMGSGAFVFADRIREEVAALSFRNGYRCTISAGVATSAGSRESGEDLLRKADRALYAAKREGGDRVVTFDGSEETAGAADSATDSS